MVYMGDVPRSDLFDDVYFSADGGPEETLHVFLEGNNLPARWQDAARFTVGETGFGTGLNFLLTWELFDRTAPKDAFLDFVSVEKYPLSAAEIAKYLAPWADRLSPCLDKLIQQYPIRVPGFHRIVFDGRVALTLIFDDANHALSEVIGNVNAWFLDGFTPSKNPDLWTDKVFTEVARLSCEGTTFSTFTSAGFVKRGLQAAGFTVEKKKGFGRKREMLTGILESASSGEREDFREKSVSILGAGLAGTSCAWVLKQYGFNPVLHDPDGIASGASGNPLGLVNPRLSAFRSSESDFYTAGFAQAVRTFSRMQNVDYHRCGTLHMINTEEKEIRFHKTVENWGWDRDHMRILSPKESSIVSGVDVPDHALYLPDSGHISPAKLCQAYASDIPLVKEKAEIQTGAIIFANGAGLCGQVSFPLHTVRGQITVANATNESCSLKTNICYGGYISAPVSGNHVIGSTFQKWMTQTEPVSEDDDLNFSRLKDSLPSLSGFIAKGSRAALRTYTTDRFPIVGLLRDVEGKAFVSTAHGSHGIVGTLAGAHLLADFLRGGPFSLGKSTIESLSSERFVRRARGKALPVS